MCSAIPQNTAGYLGRAPGLSDPVVPVRRTSNEGANSHDVSANGSETDIYSNVNAGIKGHNNSDGNLAIPQNGMTFVKGEDGSVNWAGTRTEFLPGQEFNFDTVNG